MKGLLATLFVIFLTVSGIAGPPESPEPPEIPTIKLPKFNINIDTQKIAEMSNNLDNLDDKLAKLDKMMQEFSDSIEIKNLTIGGDSIIIVLSNDSMLIFQTTGDSAALARHDDSFVNVGSKYIVDVDKIINGNIVNVGNDVIVKGTVNGSVWTLGGNIFVASTGFVRDGAIAVSGKLKVEPGGRVTNLKFAFNESRHGVPESEGNVYRVMAVVFLIIYIIWLVLAATFTSILKDNVGRVANLIKARPVRSFFLGYLAYVLAFGAFIVLCISILGIPLALVGVPVAVFAAIIMAVTSLSNLIGQKLTGSSEISFKNFLYGSLVLASLPGLFFIIQFVTGSMVIMIFSWLLIALLLFVIAPLGLGSVLKTRFGTRTGLEVPAPPSVPVPPIATPQAPLT
jgi:hypothetical protein